MDSKMKTTLMSAAAVLALSCASALAADLGARPVYTKAPMMAPVPVFDWTGFYIGAHAGYGWADATYSDPRATPGWSLNNKMNGGLFGGQLGYNVQLGNFVLGVEGEASWSGISGGATDVAPFAGDAYDTKMKWLAMGTGKLGVAFDRAMLYAKGGAVWADTEYNYNAVGFGPSSASKTRFGWTVGAGVEYAFAPNWSAKLEYNYLDFGKKTIDIVPLANGFTADIDQTAHLVKIGINYRFGGPVVARY